MVTIDPIVAAVLRLSLAALLLSSAWHKLKDTGAFRAAMTGYALLPSSFVAPAAVLLLTAEVVLGCGFLVPGLGGSAAGGCAVLLITYTAAIALNLARGRARIDCGCGGPAGVLPLSGALLVRNVLLIMLSICAALPTAPRQVLPIDLVIIASAMVTFAFLYVAAETGMANGATGQRLNAETRSRRGHGEKQRSVNFSKRHEQYG